MILVCVGDDLMTFKCGHILFCLQRKLSASLEPRKHIDFDKRLHVESDKLV